MNEARTGSAPGRPKLGPTPSGGGLAYSTNRG
ncbi:MAG: hypothetical protein RJA98_2847 [Pseudomonadota bacterium]|jgi:hypothetical protein